jgi:hypothetical protein
MGTQKKMSLSIEFESWATQNSSKMSYSTQNPDSKLIENETQYLNSFFFEFPCMV